MVACWKLVFVALCAGPQVVQAAQLKAKTQAAANPVRRVVNLLQKMQGKVEEEGKVADNLFDKYMCYCKENRDNVANQVESATDRIPKLQSEIQASEGSKTQLEADVKSHQADRAAADKAMTEGTALREKERAAYDKDFQDGSANVAATAKAIAAISGGVGDAFLQTSDASTLRAIVKAQEDAGQMPESDRAELLSFLSSGSPLAAVQEQAGAPPKSLEILGILKQMKDDMQKDMEQLASAEDAAVASHGELMDAKQKQVSVLRKAIELKLQRVADLSVEIATLENDLEDTTASLAQDQAFMKDLQVGCEKKKGIHTQEQEVRSQETVAIAETIKMLNDDDALELFKKTLPSADASFLQVQATAVSMRADARAIIKRARAKGRPGARTHLNFLMLALRGKKLGLNKISQMVAKLVHTLQSEQTDDDDKKDFCTKELDEAEDQKKTTERTVADIDTVIDETKETIEVLTKEIGALKDSIASLDKQVATATEQRKAENKEFKELRSSDSTAKELLRMARGRLQKFYLVASAAASALQRDSEGTDGGDGSSEEEGSPNQDEEQADSFLQMSAKARSMAKAGATARAKVGMQVGAKVGAKLAARARAGRGVPGPPPETAAAYAKKSGEAGGVLQMFAILIQDLEKEMTAAKVEEDNAQEDYEQLVKDSDAKRIEDAKSLTDKEANKAGMDASLEISQASRKSASQDLEGGTRKLASLHQDCDWLLQNYDVRKTARADEVDSLQKARAVLNGADYEALVQTGHVAHTRSLRRA